LASQEKFKDTIGAVNHRKTDTIVTKRQKIHKTTQIDLIFGVYRHFQQYFSYFMTTSFSGGSQEAGVPAENHRPWTSNW
jgi:hypothetical protein